MAQHVLAVLRADDDGVPPVGIGLGAPREVRHVREGIAELRGQEVDEGHVLRGRLEQRRRRREEMDVRIRRSPAAPAKIARSSEITTSRVC